MPTNYLSPYGTPLYWADEQSNELPVAMRAFVNRWLDPTQEVSEAQLALVISYLRYAINAPCWKGDSLVALRKEAAAMSNQWEVDHFIDHCLDEGIDPI